MLYVIQVYTGREHRIAECCRQVIDEEREDIFIPLYKRRKKFKGEMKTVTAVLYPGYLFCETEEPESLFQRLNTIQEMTKLLRVEENVIPVSPNEADKLYKLFGKDHVVEVSVGYIEGQQVRILEGPMEHFVGQIKKIDRHKRIAVLEMEFFGAIRQTTVGLEIIEKM